jgi:2-iminobutanoate/2-iminopropanoate deaminase
MAKVCNGQGAGEIMRKIIATNEAPQAIGPYSQAIVANGFIFTSGQIAIDPETQQVITGGIAEQTEQVLKNLDATLKAAGSGLEKVERTTIFLRAMQDYPVVNQIYARSFDTSPPARSTVEVSGLPKDVLIEIDVIAVA